MRDLAARHAYSSADTERCKRDPAELTRSVDDALDEPGIGPISAAKLLGSDPTRFEHSGSTVRDRSDHQDRFDVRSLVTHPPRPMSEVRVSSTDVEQPQHQSQRGMLYASIAVWGLLSIGRGLSAASEASGGAPRQAGAFLGAIVGTLLIVFVVRSVVRLVRGRPVLSPLWTPGLFFTAAALNLLLLAATAGENSA